MGEAEILNPTPVPRHRRWLVYALSGGLIAGHAYDVATKREHWPMSSYPMYSELTPRTFRFVRLIGHTNEDPPREISIEWAWMRSNLMRIARRPGAPAKLRRAMIQYVRAYGWVAPDPAPEGVEFTTIGVYEHVWALRADADPDRPPDESRLLAQMVRDPAEAAHTMGPRPATTPSAPGDTFDEASD